MDNFRAIYKMLRHLEKSMDCEEYDPAPLSPEALGVSRPRLDALWALIAREGYVTGVKVLESSEGLTVAVARPRITLAGLEYLQANPLMLRVAEVF